MQPKKSFSPRKSVIIIVCAIILIPLILFGMSKSVLPMILPGQQPTPQPIKEKTPANFKTSDGKNWSTYTNNNLHFSLPHPADMKAQESSYGMGVSNTELRSADSTAEDTPDYQILTFPKTLGGMIGQNFDAYKAMANNSSKVIKNPQSQTSERFVKIRNRTISNYEAIEFSVTAEPPDPDEIPEIGVYIDVGENIVIISTGEDNKAELEQMLGSFQYPVQ